jgi:hypothetical protein
MNAGEIDSVLKVDDFDVSNAREVDPKFIELDIRSTGRMSTN